MWLMTPCLVHPAPIAACAFLAHSACVCQYPCHTCNLSSFHLLGTHIDHCSTFLGRHHRFLGIVHRPQCRWQTTSRVSESVQLVHPSPLAACVCQAHWCPH